MTPNESTAGWATLPPRYPDARWMDVPATVEIDGQVYPLIEIVIDSTNPRNFRLVLAPPTLSDGLREALTRQIAWCGADHDKDIDAALTVQHTEEEE